MSRAAFCLGLILLAMQAIPAKEPTGLRAGTGRVVITPKASMWLAGYAARKSPSEGVLQDLWAKALAIEDLAGGRTVIVTTDLLGLPASLSNEIAEGAQEKFGLSRGQILLSSSHTHCGPVLRKNLEDMYDLSPEQRRLMEEYSDSLPDLILGAIGQSLSNLEPVVLAFGQGAADFAVNRRQYTQSGVVIGVNPIGPVDHSVPVLRVAREDGTLKAVLFGYACHNTTLDIMQFNGDYAGFAQAEIEAGHPNVTALFIAGCGGDQNPHPRREVDLARRHGKSLANAVNLVLAGAMESVGGPLGASYREIPLPLSPPPTREKLNSDLQSENVYKQRLAKSLLRTLDAKGSLETTYPYPVQAIRFGGDLTLIALGGEVVVDYSLRLKYELGRERLWVAAYANDVMAYVPSLRVLREGGYEAGDSAVYYGLHGPWAPETEELIIKTAVELAARQIPE